MVQRSTSSSGVGERYRLSQTEPCLEATIPADTYNHSIEQGALHSAILSESTDIIIVRNADGEFTYVSPSAERALGLSGPEIEKMAGELFHPDDLPTVIRVYERALAEPGTHERARVRLMPPHGDVRWVEMVATDLFHNPAINGLLVKLRDVRSEVETETMLDLAEQRYQSLLEYAGDVVVVVDENLRFNYATSSVERMTGYLASELDGTGVLELIHPHDIERCIGVWNALLGGGPVDRITFRIRRKSGEWAWVEVVGSDMRDRPEVRGIVLNVRDVSDRVESEQGTERLTEVLGAASDLVMISDREFRMLYLNDAARSFLSVDPDTEPTDVHITSLMSENMINRFQTDVLPALKSSGSWTEEFDIDVGDEPIPIWSTFLAHRDEAGRVQYISGIGRDMRERKQFEAELEYQATHDALTGLPNRTAVVTTIEEMLASETATGAVFFLDLDDFKAINDTHGHECGDELLVEIARRLSEIVRPGDFVARFGGDEFVVCCPRLTEHEAAYGVADRIVKDLTGTYNVGGHDVRTSASVGISFVDHDPDTTAGTLLRDADMAMYAAKDRGRSRYVVFDTDLRTKALEAHLLVDELRHAVEGGGLVLHYQPIIDLTSGRVITYEALVRWLHPERGLLMPDVFVPLAEDRGLIVAVGHWVIDRALADLRHLNHHNPDPVGVSVNLSARQLNDPSLVPTVDDALQRTSLDPALLTLEITESVVMEDVEVTAAQFQSVKQLGVQLAVDDFGTGYSSLAYLRRFPVDVLKVDREFVSGIESDAENVEIIAAIIHLAHSLGLEAIGEGVESETQLDHLRRLGCDQAQGFHLGRPQPLEALLEDRAVELRRTP